MTDELKACPFCGGNRIATSKNWINCINCGAMIQCDTENNNPITAWNTRHEPDTLPQWAIEAIEQGIEYAIVNANANQNYPVKHARYFALCESLEWVLSLRKPEDKE